MATHIDSPEIDEGSAYIGYEDALGLVYSNVHPVGIEELPLDYSVGRIAAEDLLALVDNPSSNVSLKDGFAVRSADVGDASSQRPVCFSVVGSVFAGSQFRGEVLPHSAVRVCSGSPIPAGADAVVSREFCEEVSSEVYIMASAESRRNVLRGSLHLQCLRQYFNLRRYGYPFFEMVSCY